MKTRHILIILVGIFFLSNTAWSQCAVSISTSTNTTELNCTDTVITLTANATDTVGLTNYSWNGVQGNYVLNVTSPGIYTITIMDGNDCTSSASVTISENITPPDVSALAFPDTICQDQSTVLVALGNAVFEWFDGTAVVSNVPAFSASPVQTTSYTVTGTGPNGCTATDVVTVTVNVPFSIAIQPNDNTQTPCLNDGAEALVVSAEPAQHYQYQWYLSNQPNTSGVAIAGETNAVFTPPTNIAGSNYYYCVLSVAGCNAVTSSVSGEIRVGPPTAITTQPSSATFTFCLSEQPLQPFAVQASTAVFSYQWYSNTMPENNNGTEIPGAIDNTYFPPTNTPGTTYYYCVVTGNCNPVTSDISGPVIVNEALAISDQPSSVAQTHCVYGTSTTLSVTAIAALSYQWYSNNTQSNTNGSKIPGATEASYTPATDTAGITFYYCVVNGACDTIKSSVSGAVSVNESTEVTAGPSQAGQILCIGQTAIPFAVSANGAGLNYEWFSNIDSSYFGATSLGISGIAAYTPQTSIAGKLYYYCIVNGSCTPADTTNITGAILVNPIPSASISGTATTCQSNSSPPAVIFTGSGGTAPYTFDYNINGPSNPGVTASIRNDSGFVYAATEFTGTFTYYLLSVKDSYGCSRSLTNTAVITVIGKPVLTSAGHISVCDSSVFNYTATSSSALTSFDWKRDAVPGVISNPSITGLGNTISDRPDNITDTAHEISYLIMMHTGTGCDILDSLVVTVNPTPTLGHVNDTTFCNGDIVLDGIEIIKSPLNAFVNWSVDTLIGLQPQGTGTIGAFIATNPGEAPLEANVSVSIAVGNSPSCPGDNQVFKIVVNPSAARPVFSWLNLHNGVVCSQSNNINFNVNSPVNLNAYHWSSVPANDPNINIRDTNDANTVISFINPGQYLINVTAINTIGGCSVSESQTVNVIDRGAPSEIVERKIFIKQPGNILVYPDNTMDAGDGYQWGFDPVFNDVLPDYSYGPPVIIPGQVYQFFIPDPSRFVVGGELDTTHYKYWVLLQKNGCYTKVYYNGPYAAMRFHTDPPQDNSVRVNVFPNPNNGRFQFGLKGNIYGTIQAKVYNSMGQLVWTKAFAKNVPEITELFDRQALPAGLYYVILNSTDLKKAVTRFIIQH